MYENGGFSNSLKNDRNKLRLKKIINNENSLGFSINNCLNKKRDKKKIIVIHNCDISKKDSDLVSTNNTSNYFDKDAFNKMHDLQNIFNIEEEEDKNNHLSERIYNKDIVNSSKINDKNQKIIKNIENKILLMKII